MRRPLEQVVMLRAVAIAVIVVCESGTAAQKPEPAASGPPAFEVISIRSNTSTGLRTSIARVTPGGRFSASNVSVQYLIRMAYGLRDSDQIRGPAWIAEDRFNVEATAPFEIPPITIQEASPELASMLRLLLENRFALQVRIENTVLPVYALVRLSDTKLGIRLRPTECVSSENRRPGDPIPTRPCGERAGPGLLSNRGRTIARFIDQLSRMVDRPVVDRTTLTGSFDLDLEWEPDISAAARRSDAASIANLPSLFTAVQEQLGLKLEPRQEAIPRLEVERVRRPTEN